MTENRIIFDNTLDNARKYDDFTKTTFNHVYPLIAGQILKRTGITNGICLDVGSGPGPLAIAIVLRSNLQIMALDNSSQMLSCMMPNVHALNLDARIIPLLGDVHAIPVADETFDLVISRGSYHFWNDLPTAFREVHRVMKPGGKGYIGGGYGSLEIQNEVFTGRKERGIVDNPNYPTRIRFRKFRIDNIEASIKAVDIEDYQIINDDSGFWMLLSK